MDEHHQTNCKNKPKINRLRGRNGCGARGEHHSSLICASTPKNVVHEMRLRAAGGGLEHTDGEEREEP